MASNNQRIEYPKETGASVHSQEQVHLLSGDVYKLGKEVQKPAMTIVRVTKQFDTSLPISRILSLLH